MRNESKLQALCALLALTWLAPTPSFACSRLPQRAWHGYPQEGAEDVPLDAVLVYWSTTETSAVIPYRFPASPLPQLPIISKYEGVTATLRDERGDLVELRPLEESQSRFFEIAPRAPLSPNTGYTLVLKFAPTGGFGEPKNDEVSVRFTTGTGVDSDDLSPPAATVSHYTATLVSTCEPGNTASCIGLAPDQFYEWHGVGDERNYTSRGAFFTLMQPAPEQQPPPEVFDCVEIRRRTPNGRLSQPAVVCGSDGPSYDLDAAEVDDDSRWIDCDQRGVLLGGRAVSQLLEDAQQTEGSDSESPPDADASDETDEEDTEMGPHRMPPPRRANTASCGVVPGVPNSSLAWTLVSLALALGVRRRRQG